MPFREGLIHNHAGRNINRGKPFGPQELDYLRGAATGLNTTEIRARYFTNRTDINSIARHIAEKTIDNYLLGEGELTQEQAIQVAIKLCREKNIPGFAPIEE